MYRIPSTPCSATGIIVINRAHRIAAEMGHDKATSGHLVRAILDVAESPAAKTLVKHGVNASDIEEEIPRHLPHDDDLRYAHDMAQIMAFRLGTRVEPEHLLLSVFAVFVHGNESLTFPESPSERSEVVGAQILRKLRINQESLRNELLPKMTRSFVRIKSANRE